MQQAEAKDGSNGDRPILAVDVDGVISLFGFEEPLAEAPGEFHLIDGIAHCISRAAGERLMRLADHYELVWATGWEERANEHLPTLLGLPEELPYLTFGGDARFGTAHWKVDAIDAYAGDRPLAWLDDCIDDSCRVWAQHREAPTLLVEVDSRRGLEDAHVDALLGWIESDFRPR
jgi:HAD domain in Swiss Army Knife RNA repair proteins